LLFSLNTQPSTLNQLGLARQWQAGDEAGGEPAPGKRVEASLDFDQSPGAELSKPRRFIITLAGTAPHSQGRKSCFIAFAQPRILVGVGNVKATTRGKSAS
jgi:hypothetical protein